MKLRILPTMYETHEAETGGESPKVSGQDVRAGRNRLARRSALYLERRVLHRKHNGPLTLTPYSRTRRTKRDQALS